jgi:hypothetical protein
MARLQNALPRQTPAKRWVTALALLAFLLQGLAVQTHIHPTPQPVSAQAVAVHVPVPPRGQGPVDQCRLCQELMHSGVFVTPSASFAMASPALTTALPTALPSMVASLAMAFAWQSRAPPRR